MKLCQPSLAILLISISGAIYHLLVQNFSGILWWAIVGVFGTGVFQALCFGGLEPIAWIFMLLPVLIVCFFLAVALFASRMRIGNIQNVPCDRCGRPKELCECHHHCSRCHKTPCECNH
jgi:hypothetical protein